MSSTVSIETERLLLSPVTLADIDEFVSLHEDAEVARFMGSPDRESGVFLRRTGLNRWPVDRGCRAAGGWSPCATTSYSGRA